jgi:branched-chain amino acid transport system substrate-binding protein
MLIALTLMQVLKHCGNNLSRKNVMHEAANLHELELPLLLPGIRIKPSATDYRPVKRMRPMRFNRRNWVLFGDLLAG